MKTLKVRLTFTEPVLGSMPADKEIYSKFIASKAPQPEKTAEAELDALPDEAEDGDGMKLTVFPRTDDGKPFLYDYQIKGFFKDSCGGLRMAPGTESAKVKAYKKIIDKLIFPEPRCIVFRNYGTVGNCQRPLRAQTPKGERTALAYSEEIPAGAELVFSIVMLDEGHEKLVREWLDYGARSGLGQWRNSGKGRFTWEEIEDGAPDKTP